MRFLLLSGLLVVGGAVFGCSSSKQGTSPPATTASTTSGAGGKAASTTGSVECVSSSVSSTGTGGLGGKGGAGGKEGTGGKGEGGKEGTGGKGGAGGKEAAGGAGGKGGTGGKGGAGGEPPDAGPDADAAGGDDAGDGGESDAGDAGILGSNCVWPGGCGQGLYCDTPSCGAGTCTKTTNVASVTADETPVCGCDGATYWNTSVAGYRGMSQQSTGVCPAASALPCSQNTCSGSLVCNEEAPSLASCPATATGVCWGLPLFCGAGGPQGKSCSNQACSDACSLIVSQNAWYDDGSCP